jgi:hypothetical protein
MPQGCAIAIIQSQGLQILEAGQTKANAAFTRWVRKPK